MESRYLIVQNVPAVNVVQELTNLFGLFGVIVETKILDDYPKKEQFNEVLLIKFERLSHSRLVCKVQNVCREINLIYFLLRVAKRKMDNFSFMGNVLHVFYAPEYESVDETREKLSLRRIEVARQLKLYDKSKRMYMCYIQYRIVWCVPTSAFPRLTIFQNSALKT